MRQPSDTDFFFDVLGVGKFRFARRTYGDKIRIRTEYLKLVKDSGDDDPDIRAQAAIIAAHKVLCVEAPAGWDDLETLDMLAIDNAEGKVLDVYLAFKAKEDSFRQAPNKGSADSGSGVVPDDQLLVPQAVQPEPA